MLKYLLSAETKQNHPIYNRQPFAASILRPLNQVYEKTNKSYTLFTDASKYVWSALLTEEHSTVIDGRILSSTSYCLS